MTATARRPRFSIVTAVYNVETYLADFIASIERQRVAPGDLEVVAVDDGSTDGSLDVLRRWAGTSRLRVRVFTKPNGGQGSARNLGLDHATGEWVTFTDPDDMLDREFLRVADRFARANPDVEVMAGNPVRFLEDEARLADTHPRRIQYRAGNRVVRLEDEPNIFTGSAAVSLFQLARIQDLGLRFDPRIRPNFEDGHFACHYLLAMDQAAVGILRDARYIYRIRAAGNSTGQTSLAHPGRYTDVLEHGYLDVIAAARARHGTVPEWLQHVLIYELSWYLSAHDKITSDIRLADDLVPRFHQLMGEVVDNLDPEVVARHRVRPMRPIWTDVLAHAYRKERWHTGFVVRTKVDAEMRLQRLVYRYVGEPPREAFMLDDEPVAPAFGKRRTHRYLWRPLVEERIVWLPAGKGLEVSLDGETVPITRRWHPGYATRLPRRTWGARIWLYRRLPPAALMGLIQRKLASRTRRITTPIIRAIAGLLPFSGQFRDAWVVMDRIYNADDNGERLFEHLRATRPDINAWFVLHADTPDWRRLRQAGVRRLVAYGSFRWKMLMLRSRWLVSSHADRAVAVPPAVVRLAGRPTWKYAFLQHGVIKDDLSQWLNDRDIDLFVVSTEPELESVAGDGSSYIVTDKETRLTGLPRFDRLLAKGRAVDREARDLILIAPTWRTSLTLRLDRATQIREVDPAFRESLYFRSWDAILRSEEIAAAASRRGWRVAFMPHPNMQPMLPSLDLPGHVQPLTFADNDVQELYARCAVLVTDYSSVAFNVAYLDRPVVYFQFDREEMMSGGHMGRRGYFDYARDGFGPVADDAPAAIRAIVATIESGPDPAPEYQARIDRTFVLRDGGACARVVAAIEELSRPYERPSG
jgi:glycosyltransferase involved in cell wall biosynthesis/CDP-glycerol glycerophosphotransferase (TagB/SpsB family)